MSILGGTKPNLATTEGLAGLAEKSGFEKQTKTILQSGENPKLIFSGGFIKDIFDVANAPQSIIAGMAKNQRPLDAIMSRASFSDKELLGKYGTVGFIGGIIADIATDPLMLIPPLGIGKRILQGTKWGAEMLKATKIGGLAADFLGKKLVHHFGQPEMYKMLAEDAITKINKGGMAAMKLTKPITELTSAEQRLIAAARKAGKLETLPASLLAKAKPAFDELERLGQEAVNVGLLDRAIYEENISSYIARLYRTKEMPEGTVKTLFGTKPIRIDFARFKARKDIPEEIREAMGEILEAGYPLAKSLAQINQAVERAKFFGEVASKFGIDEIADGYKQISRTNKSLGALKGKYVPEAIYDDIEEIFHAKEYGEKIAGKIVRGFKYGKVVMNPATHARNTMSGYILANLAGVPLHRMPDMTIKAIKSFKVGNKYGDEISELGVDISTFWGTEIKALLTNAGDPALKRVPKEIINKLGGVYQREESFGKRLVYIFKREKGLEPIQAWEKAEEALFNYGKVTPFIRKLRESLFGMPFITFSFKATPFVAKTLITHPARIGKYGFVKRGIENMSDPEKLRKEREAEPDYIKKGFFVRLPFEDQHNRR